MKRFFPLLSFVVLLWAVPALGWAHAAPVLYEPETSSIVARVPSSIRIRFSERVEPSVSGVIVYAPDGSQAQAGDAVVIPGDPRLLSVPLRAAGTGSYVVSWSVISADDGHFMKGSYVFSAGHASGSGQNAPSGQFQIAHQTDVPEGIAIWLELLGESLLLGTLAVHALAGRLLPPERAALTFAACVVFLPCRRRILQSGKALAGEYVVILLLLIAAVIRAQVSHASASLFLPGLSVAINTVHLLAKELWIGGVIAFLVLFHRQLLAPRVADTARLLTRFSGVQSVAFGLGGVTGTARGRRARHAHAAHPRSLRQAGERSVARP